jgi:hypothetical protein
MSSTTLSTAFQSSTLAPVRGSAGEIRLTARGRLVVLVLALMVIAVVGVLLSATSSADDDSSGYPTRTVVVAAGDTLWAIADDAAGDESTRDMVSRIQSINALDTAGLQAGQRILVPLS